MLRRQHRPTVQVPFFALGWETKNVREALRLETKIRGCELLLLRCMGVFRGCKAGVSVRHGITGRVTVCATNTGRLWVIFRSPLVEIMGLQKPQQVSAINLSSTFVDWKAEPQTRVVSLSPEEKIS